MKRSSIRGVRIEREPYIPPRGPVEDLKYSIDVYGEGGNCIEVLELIAEQWPHLLAKIRPAKTQ